MNTDLLFSTRKAAVKSETSDFETLPAPPVFTCDRSLKANHFQYETTLLENGDETNTLGNSGECNEELSLQGQVPSQQEDERILEVADKTSDDFFSSFRIIAPLAIRRYWKKRKIQNAREVAYHSAGRRRSRQWQHHCDQVEEATREQENDRSPQDEENQPSREAERFPTFRRRPVLKVTKRMVAVLRQGAGRVWTRRIGRRRRSRQHVANESLILEDSSQSDDGASAAATAASTIVRRRTAGYAQSLRRTLFRGSDILEERQYVEDSGSVCTWLSDTDLDEEEEDHAKEQNEVASSEMSCLQTNDEIGFIADTANCQHKILIRRANRNKEGSLTKKEQPLVYRCCVEQSNVDETQENTMAVEDLITLVGTFATTQCTFFLDLGFNVESTNCPLHAIKLIVKDASQRINERIPLLWRQFRQRRPARPGLIT